MDDSKPYTITLDPSYTTGGGATTSTTFSVGDDYLASTTDTGDFSISTSMPEYGWGNDISVPEEGDIKIGNRSLKTFMDTMEKRMAILQPDPKKLEKFEALKKAYEHYKHLESLCELEDEEKGPNW